MNQTLFLNKNNIKICASFINRFKGMMFNKNKDNKIFCFPKCNSIHTFFMLKNIDVIMADKNNNIIIIYQNVKPWRIILPKKNIYYTYEINSNSIQNITSYNKIVIN